MDVLCVNQVRDLNVVRWVSYNQAGFLILFLEVRLGNELLAINNLCDCLQL